MESFVKSLSFPSLEFHREAISTGLSSILGGLLAIGLKVYVIVFVSEINCFHVSNHAPSDLFCSESSNYETIVRKFLSWLT